MSDDTIYRALEDLNVSHVSARPNAYRQVAEAMETIKRTLPYALRKSARNPRRAPQGVVPRPCGCRRPVRPRSHDGSARSRRPQAYRAHEPDQRSADFRALLETLDGMHGLRPSVRMKPVVIVLSRKLHSITPEV